VHLWAPAVQMHKMPVADGAQDGKFSEELSLSLHALRVQLFDSHLHRYHPASVHLPKSTLPNDRRGREVVGGLNHLRTAVGLQVRKLRRMLHGRLGRRYGRT